jgi:glycosyltransferase involved in cell wall biosynthesis
LTNILEESTYYWHAGGYGVDKNNPEKMEHFGITVVESLNAGLIPIVFDIAGPAEVLNNIPELRYKSLDELVRRTNELSSITHAERESLKQFLRSVGNKFDLDSFRKVVLNHLRGI